MRILFLNHNVAWQGGFFRAYHWGRQLKNLGHQVTLMTISEGNYVTFSTSEKDGVLIIKSPDLLKGRLRTGWDIWDTLLRIFYLVNKKYDIIHCVDTRPNVVLPGLVLKKLGKGKLVLDWGDWWGRGGTINERSNNILEKIFAPIETFFEEHFRRYADGSVVLTEALRQRAIKLGVKEDTIVRIPHGADVKNIIPRDKYKVRSKLNIDKNKKILGYIGTIFPSDAHLLISAFKIIDNELNNTHLYIIGNCKAQFPDNLIKSGKIVKTGKVDFDSLLNYVAICDIMLLPLVDSIANRGRWPSKVCDYLSAGKPVVSTNVGDISFLLKDNGAGHLCAAEPHDFADSVIKMLKKGSLLDYGKKAREIAEKELSWGILTKRLENFYERVLES